jgi:3-hydroxyacyl-[acyl-carrier-protein] dehydratase
MITLTIEEIQKILPQRYPFLMVDRVIELDPGKKIAAVKNVSYNEEFFSGHFPGKPVMPGVLMIEAMAQASILLLCAGKDGSLSQSYTYYLGSTKVRFLHPVTPGDQLLITAQPVKVLAGIGIVEASITVGGKEVCRGEISFSAKKNE